MPIVTPAQIETIAWEGALEMPAAAYSLPTPTGPGLVVTLGKPEIWPAGDVLERELGVKWHPPIAAGAATKVAKTNSLRSLRLCG
jgi:hypothetical protein